MGEWIESCADGPEITMQCVQHFSITLPAHPAVDGYPTLLRAGEEQWCPTSVTPLLLKVCSLTAVSPTTTGYETTDFMN